MRWSLLLAGLGVLAAFVLVGALGNLLAPAPQGPALSSFATTPAGLAAWATLLAEDGHRVRQLRAPLANTRLAPDTTLIVLPRPTPAMLGTLRAFVRRGGRLVTGTGLGGPEGRGQIVVLASLATVENRALGRGANALHALDFAGAPGRPVVFDEAIHGYGPATGLAALPARWWAGLALLAGAAGAWLLARGRRLGGPDPSPATAPPPRSDYVEAMAGRLRREVDEPALAELVAAARGREQALGRLRS